MKKILFLLGFMFLFQGCGDTCSYVTPISPIVTTYQTYPSNTLYNNGAWTYPVPQYGYQTYYYYNGVRCRYAYYYPTGWYLYQCDNAAYYYNVWNFYYYFRK